MLSALDQDAPVFGDGHFAIESRGGLTGFYLYSHIKFTIGSAAEDAVGGGYVCIIAADCGAEVAMVGNEIVGGIEADPAEMGHESLNPCVGGVGCRAVVVLAAAIEIAGDITGWNPDMAQQGDHGVSKVLADALSADDGFVDG